jgi:cell division septum initiation protein DivIVA
MTDHTLARADEVLTELVELIETARTLPMSSSCVVPRERTLDLLDALREVLPPELAEARRLVAKRDRMLSEADALTQQQLRRAQEESEATTAAAQARARTVVEAAERQAEDGLSAAAAQARELVEAGRREQEQLVEAGRREQEQLVSADSVHQRAVAEAARLRSETEQQCRQQLAAAGEEAGRLTAQAHDYAYGTLSELVDNLQRLASTAENGRAALGQHPPTPPA